MQRTVTGWVTEDGSPVELTGDHITMTEYEDGSAEFKFSAETTGRRCGGCQLCCRLVPVASLNKPAGEKCRHAKVGHGCTIYRFRPHDCRTWACRWLAQSAETAGLRRPDRSHYVIDLTYDTVHMLKPDGEKLPVSVLQVWVDPAFPDAHRDPALRRYLANMGARYRVAALVRYGASKGFVLYPPAMCADGQWHEQVPKEAGDV